MDGSEKLCFNKVLSQLSDITDKLSGGGTELETVTGKITGSALSSTKLCYHNGISFVEVELGANETIDIQVLTNTCIIITTGDASGAKNKENLYGIPLSGGLYGDLCSEIMAVSELENTNTKIQPRAAMYLNYVFYTYQNFTLELY